MEQVVTAPTGSRRNEDIALDLLKFVAASAGLGRGTTPAAGFVAAAGAKTEEQVTQLLALYSKCLVAVQGK
jgi:hypothetical protein